MSLFDSLKSAIKNTVTSSLKNEINSAVNTAANKLTQKSETFTFNVLPKTLSEFQALPESDLSTPFKTATLTVLALACYNESPEDSFAILEWLNGPNELTGYNKDFIKEHLTGKQYIINSYFNGSSTENNYTPSQPYSITISDNPYSYLDENWARMYVTSTGADAPRQIRMRLKPSTNQWFLNEQFLLAGIRIPKEENPWE